MPTLWITLAALALTLALIVAWWLRATPRIAATCALFLLAAPAGLYAALGQPQVATLMQDHANTDHLVQAARRAVLESGGDPALILAYNKALILAADGEITDEAKTGLELVLKLVPGEPEARYFLAIRTLQEGHTQAAMQQMKALYHDLPKGHPLRTRIDEHIGRRP